MLTRIISAAVLITGLGLADVASSAPLSPTSLAGTVAHSPVVRVAGGCGPGFFRTPYGFCRPFRRVYGPRFYGPRPYYGRRCFFRPTPFGPRRVCRF